MKKSLLFCLLVLLGSCATPVPPKETPIVFVIATSTYTPIPSHTPIPTLTPTATPTPRPTSTHTPTAVLMDTPTSTYAPIPTRTALPTLAPTHSDVPISQPVIKRVNQRQDYEDLVKLAENDERVVIIEGTGDDVGDVVLPNYGVLVVATGNACYGAFTAVVSDTTGTGEGDALFSSSIPYAGTTIYYSSDREITLEVKADCAWGIALSDLSDASISQIAANGDIVVGNGNAVVAFSGTDAQHISAEYGGNAVFTLTAWGDEQVLAFMESGSFSGTVVAVEGLYLLEIETIGNWRVTIE